MNKKLLKSLVSITSGIAIVSSIPVSVSSCSAKESKVSLPESVYYIDENDVLRGFREGINLSQYDGICDAIQVPAKITSIADGAFTDYTNAELRSKIPPFITKIIFEEGSNCSSIGNDTFANCSSLTSVSFPSCLETIGQDAFLGCSSLASISLPSNLKSVDHATFMGCSALTSVDFSNCINLLLIGSYAFTGCSALTSVSFPSNLHSIGVKAFNNCSNLSSITWDRWKGDTVLPNDPESLPFLNISSAGAIIVTNPNEYDNVNLLHLLVNRAGLPESWLPAPELPEDVYWIENNVLKGFSTKFLENPSAYRLSNTMEIPARVTSIANQAFWDENYGSIIPDFITKLTFEEGSHCSSIGQMGFNMSPFVSVTLPDSLTGIYQNAFEDCTSLTSVSFPSSLQFINEYAFSDCSKLEIVNLSSCANLSSIGGWAFRDCSSLTSVSFPISLESIGDSAFMFCNLSSVILPKNLTTVGRQVFNHNINLSSITWDAWNGDTNLSHDSFIGVCPTGGTITVTNPIDDRHNAPELLNYLVENAKLPESWRVLPDEVYDITDGVLKGFSTGFLENPSAYSKYTTMQIPANVTEVNRNAFFSTSTSTTTIPSFITRLTFAEGSKCEYILQEAFQNCSSLVSIDFSDATSLRLISGYVFKNCSKLTSINFPSSLEMIEVEAFENCDALTSIDLSNCRDLTSIGNDTFANCSSLTSINFPSSLKTIAQSAFQNCSALTSADFSNATNLCSIGPNCFQMCSSLTSIDLSKCFNLSLINGYAFNSCTSLSSVTFPSSLQTIGDSAFNSCSALKYIAWVLPDNYQNKITIGESAFANISPSGKVESLINPWITSQEFLDWIKTKGGFPTTGWDTAN